eukprot:1161159-Pelagomonas_calceolata.AAC.6
MVQEKSGGLEASAAAFPIQHENLRSLLGFTQYGMQCMHCQSSEGPSYHHRCGEYKWHATAAAKIEEVCTEKLLPSIASKLVRCNAITTNDEGNPEKTKTSPHHEVLQHSLVGVQDFRAVLVVACYAQVAVAPNCALRGLQLSDHQFQ